VRKLLSMRSALEDPLLFGAVLPGESWGAWRVLLIAAMGEPLTDLERAIFRSLTGRDWEPGEPVEEFWAIIGRRGGKSRAVAVLGAYVASLVDVRHVLAPGERASLPIMSASLWQAGKINQYLDGIFSTVPALRKLVTGQTSDTISLSTRVDIECRPASFRTIRGGTMAAVIGDEVAFWRNEHSANPDTEILNAARPGVATTGGIVCCISSPYARTGECYEVFRRHFGPNGDPKVLVANAPSRVMNPTLKQSVVDRAHERDPQAAAAEYGGAFRNDLEVFLSRETIDAALVPGRIELPPVSGVRYTAFVDPSGGASDAMTLGIAHKEGETAVLDCVCVATPPFSPEEVTKQFAETLKRYRIYSVRGDRYAGEWPRERFRVHGITYEIADKPKSDIYRDCLPLFTGSRVELLDNKRLVSELQGLERRTSRGGRDSIDHRPGAHDDVANAACGALTACSAAAQNTITVHKFPF
jgi:hypothetical protein